MTSESTNPSYDILMTIALPYANGPIHLGHVVEAIQADIWRRWQLLQGQRVLFVCGTDAHGTPVMLSALQQNKTPEQLINEMQIKHQHHYRAFHIDFDIFHTTHSPENKILAELIYQRLQTNGDISHHTISQAFDPEKGLFLADRFIRGNCPRCDAPNQYGDNCEVCGSSYSPSDLKNPVSALSGATPIVKDSVHYFFNLENYRDLLNEWVTTEHLQPQIVNKLKEWFDAPLKPWDISRDAPYFGFEIPDSQGKYFYVWMDAPIGYMAATQKFCTDHGSCDFDNFWQPNATTRLFHFVGKDVIYFHALFWPAMLHGANFRLPTRVYSHGFLTINGQKMSKSKGTFITAEEYLQHLNPEYLRYYLAAKLSGQVEDIDFNVDDFRTRVNADLIGKFINLASRSAAFINKQFAGQLSNELPDKILFDDFVMMGQQIGEHFEQLNYTRAIREIMALADRANQYIDQQQPWTLAKDPERKSEVQAICTQGLNLFKLLATYLKPILPETAQLIEQFLNIKELSWQHRAQPLVSHTIHPFQPLWQRIPQEAVDAIQV